MEENKFEKQVKQQMDEFTIQPSETVWAKIEMQIEKKRRRGLVVILSFLFLCIALPGSYWLWNIHQQKLVENKEYIKDNLGKSIDNGIKKNEKHSGQSKIDTILNFAQKSNTPVINEDEMQNKKNIKKFMQQSKFSTASKKNAGIFPPKQSSITSLEKEKLKINGQIKNEIEIQKETQESIQKSPMAINGPNDSLNEKLNPGTLLKSLIEKNIAKTADTLKQEQSIPKFKKKLPRNQWRTGVLFAAGLSNVGNNFLAINNSAYYSYDPGFNNSTSGGSPQGNFYYPSNPRHSFGFRVGVFEERNISPKTKIAFGLNFKSFRIKNKVGNVISGTGTSADLYSAQNAINNYNNYFNFIELPVNFKAQIGMNKNIPLSWQAGIVISQLINTNALQFNPAGYYYKNNSLFNKTQLGLNTGLFATLFSKQKNPLSIGPFFYYDVTHISSQGLYNKKHFVFTGLQAEILFGK